MGITVNRPILRYHGGKWMLAPWIISHFPKHRIYTEGYGGAASVLMQKPECYAEVYNDKWSTVVDVFRVMRDPDMAMRLKTLIELTPFSREEFNLCNAHNIVAITDIVERARMTIFRSFAGFGSAPTNGAYATGFRANANRSGTTPAHDWMNYPKNITSFIERLRGVVIENTTATRILLQHDTTETLHFLDPPYVHDTRNMDRGNAAYEEVMSDDDHREMDEICQSLKGMVIVCGYHSNLYDDLFPPARGQIIRRSAFADGAS